jgi:hypothetical protein
MSNQKWEVQTLFSYGWDNVWENVWNDYDDDNNTTPVTFDSPEEAQAELDDMFNDVAEAVARGDMDTMYDRDDYRIVPVGTPSFP